MLGPHDCVCLLSHKLPSNSNLQLACVRYIANCASLRTLSLGAHSFLPLSRLRPVDSRRRCTRVRHKYKLKCKKKRTKQSTTKLLSRIRTQYIRNTNARRQFVCRTWMKRDCTTQRQRRRSANNNKIQMHIVYIFSFRSNSSLETKTLWTTYRLFGEQWAVAKRWNVCVSLSVYRKLWFCVNSFEMASATVEWKSKGTRGYFRPGSRNEWKETGDQKWDHTFKDKDRTGVSVSIAHSQFAVCLPNLAHFRLVFSRLLR